MENLEKIGFGGGCHWCTEAVFQVLIGVKKVDQGYLSTRSRLETFYEGVIVHFDPEKIKLKTLIKVHLKTHQSSSNHSMRSKYLSAIYSFNDTQHLKAHKFLDQLKDKKANFITKVFPIGDFKASREEIRNYYQTDPERPFCKTYIDPKLKILGKEFSDYLK